jgi:hypothetical protein
MNLSPTTASSRAMGTDVAGPIQAATRENAALRRYVRARAIAVAHARRPVFRRLPAILLVVVGVTLLACLDKALGVHTTSTIVQTNSDSDWSY